MLHAQWSNSFQFLSFLWGDIPPQVKRTKLICAMYMCMVAYLKIKMKSMRSMQKVATLSMVFISTTSCLCRAGMKRTSFSTRISRKVRSTDRPPPCWPTISHTLFTKKTKENRLILIFVELMIINFRHQAFDLCIQFYCYRVTLSLPQLHTLIMAHKS